MTRWESHWEGVHNTVLRRYEDPDLSPFEGVCGLTDWDIIRYDDLTPLANYMLKGYLEEEL